MKIIVEFKSNESIPDKKFEGVLLRYLKILAKDKFKILSIIPSGEITFDLIEKKVSEHTKIPIERIHKKTRDQYVVEARRLCYYLSKECNVGTSWREIGERFGNKEHATAYTAWLKATHYLQNDIEFKKRNKIFIQSFKNETAKTKIL